MFSFFNWHCLEATPRGSGVQGFFWRQSRTLLTSFCPHVGELFKSRRQERRSTGFHVATSHKSEFFTFLCSNHACVRATHVFRDQE